MRKKRKIRMREGRRGEEEESVGREWRGGEGRKKKRKRRNRKRHRR